MSVFNKCCNNWVDPPSQPSREKHDYVGLVIMIFVTVAAIVGVIVLRELAESREWLAGIPAFGVIFCAVIAGLLSLLKLASMLGLIGYDGWVWVSEDNELHLDKVPPQYRRGASGILLVRTTQGWDESGLERPPVHAGQGKKLVAKGPIVSYGVGWWRRVVSRFAPNRYGVHHFSSTDLGMVKVTTRDGHRFRLEQTSGGGAVIEDLPSEIMNLLQRHAEEGTRVRDMISEPVHLERRYRSALGAVDALVRVIGDRNRVGGQMSAGNVRQYLQEVGENHPRSLRGWSSHRSGPIGPGPEHYEELLQELFPPKG